MLNYKGPLPASENLTVRPRPYSVAYRSISCASGSPHLVMVAVQQGNAAVELEKQAVAASDKVGPATPTTPTQEKRAWADDVQDIPKNNLPLVFFSLLLATFLVCFRYSH